MGSCRSKMGETSVSDCPGEVNADLGENVMAYCSVTDDSVSDDSSIAGRSPMVVGSVGLCIGVRQVVSSISQEAGRLAFFSVRGWLDSS